MKESCAARDPAKATPQISAVRMPLPLSLRLNGSRTCFATTAGAEPGYWTLDIRLRVGTTAL